jgi:hypothetical protein
MLQTSHPEKLKIPKQLFLSSYRAASHKWKVTVLQSCSRTCKYGTWTVKFSTLATGCLITWIRICSKWQVCGKMEEGMLTSFSVSENVWKLMNLTRHAFKNMCMGNITVSQAQEYKKK